MQHLVGHCKDFSCYLEWVENHQKLLSREVLWPKYTIRIQSRVQNHWGGCNNLGQRWHWIGSGWLWWRWWNMGRSLINFERKSCLKDLLMGLWEKCTSQAFLQSPVLSNQEKEVVTCQPAKKLGEKQVLGRLKFGLLFLTCYIDNAYWLSTSRCWGSRGMSLELKGAACLQTWSHFLLPLLLIISSQSISPWKISFSPVLLSTFTAPSI